MPASPVTNMNNALTNAATGTMQGGANVTLDLYYGIEGFPNGTARMTGTVDFDSGRCRLSGDKESRVLDGADEYMTGPEGQWIVKHAAPGTLSTMDPRWLLSRLTDSVATSDQDGNEIGGALDREDAAKTSTDGISDEWTPMYRVTLNGERIARMAFECVDADGKVAVSWTFELSPADVPPIALPDKAVDSRDYLAQHFKP